MARFILILCVLCCCVCPLVESTMEGSSLQENLTQFSQDTQQIAQFKACSDYFLHVDEIMKMSSNLHDLPVSFQHTLQYSGRYFNDMGEVDTCRELPGMTFVRITIKLPPPIPLTVFQGFCLVEACNAAVLNSNKLIGIYNIQMIVRTLFSVIISQPLRKEVINDANINLSSYSFEPFEEYTQSEDDSSYFIAISSILICITAALVSPIVKALFSPSKKFQQSKESIQKQEKAELPLQSNAYLSTQDSPPLPPSQQEKPTSQKRRRQPVWMKIIECWNVVANGKKMFQIRSNNEDLLVFNGIRTLCFMQVILGHEFYLHINYMNNPLDIMIEQNKPFVLFAISCLYSVDVFFWLGGFFLSYVVADAKMARNFSLKKPAKVVSGFLFAIINRVFRIWPCYFLVLMFFWKIVPYFSGSPTWDILFNASDNCNSRWWQNLLFIDNMFPGQYEKCFGWGWYLSNDFQMFIFGMILLIVYSNNRVLGKLLIFLSFAAVQTVSIVLSYKWNFKIPMNAVNLGVPHYYDDYYTKPWTRSPPYFIGLYLGILYKEYQADKLKKNGRAFFSRIEQSLGKSMWKWMCYGFGTVLYTGIVFGPNYLQVNGLDAWPNKFQNFWFGTCRTFYVIAVSCFVIPGMLGSKDMFVKFYSNKMFAFVQKLSFCGYLTHYIIILYTIWQTRDSIYYNVENLLELFITEAFLTLLAAIVVTLIIEIPIANLSAILLGGRKPTAQKSTVQLGTSLPSDAQKSVQDQEYSTDAKGNVQNNQQIKQSILSIDENDSLDSSLVQGSQAARIN